MPLETLFIAALGGILPALVWLWFWTKEDRLHPEPRKVLLAAFLGGMIAVPLVIPLQQYAYDWFGMFPVLLFVIWAGIEEIFKFGASWFFALKRKVCDEPIDAMIYLLTTALGFAALENTLFLLHPLAQGDWTQVILTGNFRFLGASLVHVVSSTVLGVTLALSFYKSKTTKIIYGIIGLTTAIALHSWFNLFIIKSTKYPAFFAFIGVWIAVIMLIVVFEKVKKIYPNQ